MIPLYKKYLSKVEQIVGKGITSSEQIEDVLSKIIVRKPENYIGVNKNLDDLKDDQYTIHNSGYHWLVVVKHDGELYQTDSFSRDGLLGGNVELFDSTPNQNDSQQNCGAHAITTALLLDKNSFEEARRVCEMFKI